MYSVGAEATEDLVRRAWRGAAQRGARHTRRWRGQVADDVSAADGSDDDLASTGDANVVPAGAAHAVGDRHRRNRYPGVDDAAYAEASAEDSGNEGDAADADVDANAALLARRSRVNING